MKIEMETGSRDFYFDSTLLRLINFRSNTSQTKLACCEKNWFLIQFFHRNDLSIKKDEKKLNFKRITAQSH